MEMKIISDEDLCDLSDAQKAEEIYEALMLSGIKAASGSDSKLFSKACRRLIRQYLSWSDYIHSNNVMQLMRDTFFEGSKRTPKPTWYLRYEVVIYGRRTPLYFIDKPNKLFEKANGVYKAGKADQSEKMTSAIVSLFDYYKTNFLSLNAQEEDRELFLKHFNDSFAKAYESTDKTLFPKELITLFKDYIEYAKNPEDYFEPGKTKQDIVLDEEDEDSVFVRVEKPEPPVVEEKQCPGKPNYEKIDPEEASKEQFKYLAGKEIRFIGALNGTSSKNFLQKLAKTSCFSIEFFDDYEKITNMDFHKMQYSKIDGIIAGPMPHSIKGMGSYSSGLEMLLKEPGYPPTVACYNGSGSSKRLKVTNTSIRNALKELNDRLGAN